MTVPRRLRELLGILKDALLEWDRDNVSRLAAALAYYTVFSLAPLLVIVVAVAGFVFGEEAARGEIVRQIEGLMGPEGARLVEGAIRDADRGGSGLLATAVGLLALLVGATGAFAQLQGGLNTVWEVAPRPGRAVRGLLRTRALSFAMVVAVGFLLLVSLVVSTALEAFGGYLDARLPWMPLPLGVVNGVLSLATITVLFAMIYQILPDAELSWRDVWLGSAITALLFVIGKELIGLYLGNSTVGSAYGAAGTLAILLIWIYYSAQIFYFGAEITQVNAVRKERSIRPAPYATRMVRVRVQAENAFVARELAAAAVEERMQEAPTDSAVAADGAGSAEAEGASATRSAGGAVRVAPARPGGGAVERTREFVEKAPVAHPLAHRGPQLPDTAPGAVAVIGPEPSRFERFTAVVAGLLVGIVVGALSIKRHVDVSRGGTEP